LEKQMSSPPNAATCASKAARWVAVGDAEALGAPHAAGLQARASRSAPAASMSVSVTRDPPRPPSVGEPDPEAALVTSPSAADVELIERLITAPGFDEPARE
jgi:hypothetical protein